MLTAAQQPLTTTLVPSSQSHATSAFRPLPVSFFDVALVAANNVGAHALQPTHAGDAVYAAEHDALVVRCIDDAYIAVRRIQSKGKPARSASEWWLGFRDRADERGCVHFVDDRPHEH